MKALSNFLIIVNADKDENLEYSIELKNYFTALGAVSNIACSEDDYDEDGHIKASLMEGVEAVVVMGGDGTMLRAAHAIGDRDVYVIGVNLGTLGFLTEIDTDRMEHMAKRLVSGDYKVENRMMLKGAFHRTALNQEYVHTALNDICICRSGILRIIALKVYVNGRLLETYDADGVIIATPTGSTGYNLSAGGPLISPNTNVIVITPISPHSLSKKSIVFSSEDRIEIELVKKRKTQEDEAVISFDGATNYNMSIGDKIEITSAKRKVKLIKMYDLNFYEVLNNKIGR